MLHGSNRAALLGFLDIYWGGVVYFSSDLHAKMRQLYNEFIFRGVHLHSELYDDRSCHWWHNLLQDVNIFCLQKKGYGPEKKS